MAPSGPARRERPRKRHAALPPLTIVRLAEHIQSLRTLAHAHGRTDALGFGMRLQIICREDEKEAWRAAEKLIEGASDHHKTMIKTMFGASEANRRMQELATQEDHRILPNLWAGITTVRPLSLIHI